MNRAALPVVLLALLCTADPSSAQPAPVWIIGGEEEIEDQLGRLPQVYVLPRHVLVIERDGPFLKLFDHAGRKVQVTGRSGGGPGEFRRPTAAAYDSSKNELLVLDGNALRITKYPLADSLLAPRVLGIAEPGAVDICLMGSRLYATVRNAPTMIRRLEEQANRFVAVSSFGTARVLHPLGDHPAMKGEAAGFIHCDAPRERLVVVSKTMGEAHVISTNGGEHRTIPLPGYEPMRFSVEGGQFFADQLFLTPHDLVTATVDYQGMRTIVVGRGTIGPAGRALDGYLLLPIDSLEAGRVAELVKWRPAGALGSRTLCVQDEPYPTIALFEGARCP